MFSSILANIVATLAVLPLLSFALIYAAVYFLTKSKEEALQWAITITTILFLISIPLTLQHIWGVSLIWLIILIVLCIIGGLAYLQYLIHGKINYSRLMKGIVRLTFLLFLPIHVILYLWVVIEAMIQSAA
jgi:hypothetical protein